MHAHTLIARLTVAAFLWLAITDSIINRSRFWPARIMRFSFPLHDGNTLKIRERPPLCPKGNVAARTDCRRCHVRLPNMDSPSALPRSVRGSYSQRLNAPGRLPAYRLPVGHNKSVPLLKRLLPLGFSVRLFPLFVLYFADLGSALALLCARGSLHMMGNRHAARVPICAQLVHFAWPRNPMRA